MIIDDLAHRLNDEEVDFNEVLKGMRMDLSVEFDQDAALAPNEASATASQVRRNVLFETKFRILAALAGQNEGTRAKLSEISIKEIGQTPEDKNHMTLLNEKGVLEVITHLQFRIVSDAVKKLLEKLPVQDREAFNAECGDEDPHYKLTDRYAELFELAKWVD